MKSSFEIGGAQGAIKATTSVQVIPANVSRMNPEDSRISWLTVP